MTRLTRKGRDATRVDNGPCRRHHSSRLLPGRIIDGVVLRRASTCFTNLGLKSREYMQWQQDVLTDHE